MIYRDINFRKTIIDKNDLEYLNSGCCANVYRYKDNIFKEYKDGIDYVCRMKVQLFNVLKQINNPHFIELYTIYSRINLLEYLKYKLKKDDFYTEAYTAKYYHDDKINVLYESTDYLLDNFRDLELLFDEISKCGICANDLKYENTIFTKNNIIIIDPDIFYFYDIAQSNLIKKNKILLVLLLENILINSKFDTNEDIKKDDYLKQIDKLTSVNYDENKDVISQIARNLNRVKKPIEFFRK